MVAVSFIGISTLEYIGLFVALLALFRYTVNYYWVQIIFTSTICSVLSYALSVQADIPAAPLIQLVILIICMWLMFYTSLLWSIIISVSFFIVYAVFQGGVIYIFFRFNFIPYDVQKTSISMYFVQLICSAVCVLIGYYWERRKLGFLFVPANKDIPFIWNRTGKWLLLGSIVSFSAMGISYILYTKTHFEWFVALLMILAIISGGLLYILMRKNREYVQELGNR